jgi:hypothetical protein
MGEKRELRRRHLIYYLRVFDRNTDQLLGHLVNITPQGIMLISEEPLAVDVVFQLRMKLPSAMVEFEYLDFEAKSIWNGKDSNPNFYDTGLKLIDVAPERIAIVDDLIGRFSFQD